MKIKIYQINMDRDNGNYSFTNYENTIRRTGGGIRSSIYDCVFDGEVACKGLEEVYEKFNIDSPPGFKGHSLSVSDIVEIAESDSVEKGYYFCDSIRTYSYFSKKISNWYIYSRFNFTIFS